MFIANTVLQDRYQIELFRGKDATGELYTALDLLYEKTVSLRAVLIADKAQLKKLEDEARELIKVNSPALASVMGFFREDDRFLVVSEFIKADDLSKVLEDEGGVLSPYQAMHWAMQVAEALNYLHNLEFSLTHANIRPQNIKLVGDSIILQDFGLAASFAGRTFPKPDSEDPSNVWSYLSPEQFAGRVEPLSDIYSLGASLYALMTNVVPANAVMRAEAVKKGKTDPLLPLGQLNSEVPSEIAQIVMQAMALQPYERRWEPISREALRMNSSVSSGLVPATRRVQFIDRFTAEPERIQETLIPSIPGTTGSTPSDHAAEPAPPPYLDENVQFTVYRPKTIVPQKWHSLLAFAHLSEKREDAPADEPDPVKEVRQQALQLLGEQADDYQNVTQDTLQAIPHEGTLTFVPSMPGIEFNPPSRSFVWEESVHREEFRVRAAAESDGRVVKGRLSVFLGSILLADIPLSIRVDSRELGKGQRNALEKTNARPYRKIFASYSHKDRDVVAQFEHYVEALGDKYLRDVTYLRAGEKWNDKLEEMIVKADIFQLFWSSNSMNSPFVKQEWEYALSLQRPNFIRPTYWEEPLPNLPEKKLPPEELMRLHFQRIQSGEDSPRPEVGSSPVTSPKALDSETTSKQQKRIPKKKKASTKKTSGKPQPGPSYKDQSVDNPPGGGPVQSSDSKRAESVSRPRTTEPAEERFPGLSSITADSDRDFAKEVRKQLGIPDSDDSLDVFWDKRLRGGGRAGVGGLASPPTYGQRGVGGGGRDERTTGTSSLPPHMRDYLPQSSRSGAGGSSGAFGDLESARSGGGGRRLDFGPQPASKGSPRLIILGLVLLGLLAVILYFYFG